VAGLRGGAGFLTYCPTLLLKKTFFFLLYGKIFYIFLFNMKKSKILLSLLGLLAFLAIPVQASSIFS